MPLNLMLLAKQLKMMRLLAMFSVILTRNTTMLLSPRLMEIQPLLLMISTISSMHMIYAMMRLKILVPSPPRQTLLAMTLVLGAAVLIMVTRTTEALVVEVATAVAIAVMMIAVLMEIGAEMMTAMKETGAVMMTGVIAVMTGVTVVLMVVVVFTIARVVLARTVPLPLMSIQIVRYARYMATLRVTAGGVTLMTKMMMVIVVRRVHTLLPMVSTPTGTLIRGLQITSPMN
jgi:hypothetical protein